MKKMLSFLLVTVLCLSLVPASALAEEVLPEEAGFEEVIPDASTESEPSSEETEPVPEPEPEELLPEEDPADYPQVLNFGKYTPSKTDYHNGHTYAVYSETLTWSEAKTYCESIGGHLATVCNNAEQSFLESLAAGRNVWIGAFRDESFIWYWVTGEIWEYTNWAAGEPNNSSNVVSNETCAALWPYTWNDLADTNKSEQSGFICEWEHDNNSSDEKAIIVVPGITGSELYGTLASGDEVKVWLGEKDGLIPYDDYTLAALLYELQLDEDGNTQYNIYAKDDSVSKYGTLDTYKKLITALEDAYSDEYDVRFFSYDWRLTNALSAEALHDFISENGYQEVILVAHSMGGIVCSAYIDKYGDSKVDKLITLGTPYYGAPKALGAFMTGYFLDADSAFVDKAQRWIIKNLAPNMCGLYELLPLPTYFENGFFYVADSSGDKLDFAHTTTFMKKCSWCNKDIYNQSLSFYAGIADTYERLRNGDVNAYFIVGYNVLTPEMYSADRKGDLSRLVVQYSGDGTVPLQSAAMAYGVNDSRLYGVNGVDHTGLAQNAASIQLVKNIIDGKGDSDDFASGCGKKIVRGSSSIQSKTYSGCEIRAACPVDMAIYDGDGTLIGSFENGQITAAEGYENNLFYLGEDCEIKIAFVPEGSTVEINGTGEGTMDLTVSEITDGEVTETVNYSLVDITEDTVIEAQADASEDAVISVDTDGDGIEDKTLTQDIANDITGDHAITAADLVALMKNLSGMDNPVVENNLDVNGDDTVDLLDLVALMKALAG